MRRQDELLALYPTQGASNRKFILSEVDRLVLAFDSEELLEFVQQETHADEPIVRHQALFALMLCLPGFVSKKYGVSPVDRGIWSNYAGDLRNSSDPVSALASDPGQAESRRQATMHLLIPLLEPVLALVEHASPEVRFMARMALAQYPVQSAQEGLFHTFEKSESDFAALAGFLRSGGGQLPGDALGDLTTRLAAAQPDYLMIAAALRRSEVESRIASLAAKTNLLGRINLAIALRHANLQDPRPAVKNLVAFREPWVDVYCLRALEATGDLACVDEVIAIHDQSSHEFVRSQAIRAAGGLVGKKAQEFCLSQLSKPSPSVQAQALESLVRLRCNPDLLRSAAAPLVKSPSLRARVNALLATQTPEGDKIPEPLWELVYSSEPMWRVEAAYCLGYWQNRGSLACLATLASMDPHPIVSAQAVKSLSKYPSRSALFALLPLIINRTDTVAVTAARVLARYEGDEAREVSTGLMEALKLARNDFSRSLMYRSLGALAGKVKHEAAASVLAAGLREEEPRTLVGALEGWKMFGCSGGVEVRAPIRQISASKDPNLASRALVVSFLLGLPESVGGLGDKLKSADVPTILRALEAAMELGLLATEVVPAGHFLELEATFKATEPGLKSRAGLARGGALSRCWAPPPRGSQEYGPPPEEAEFDVHPMKPGIVEQKGETSQAPPFSRPSRKVAIGSPRSTGKVPAEKDAALSSPELAKLKKHLSTPQLRGRPRPDQLGRGLEQNTYLVGDLGAITRGLYSVAGLISVARQVLGYLLANKILMVPPAALLVVTLIFIFGAPKSRPRAAPPARKIALTVLHVEGKALTGSPAHLLKDGDVIEVGGSIEVHEGALMRCLTLRGSRVEVRSEGRLTAKGVAGDLSRLDVDLARGNYVFDFSQGGAVQIRLGAFTIMATEARLVIGLDAGRLVLRAEAGSVSLTRESGVPEQLAPGEKRDLE